MSSQSPCCTIASFCALFCCQPHKVACMPDVCACRCLPLSWQCHCNGCNCMHATMTLAGSSHPSGWNRSPMVALPACTCSVDASGTALGEVAPSESCWSLFWAAPWYIKMMYTLVYLCLVGGSFMITTWFVGWPIKPLDTVLRVVFLAIIWFLML